MHKRSQKITFNQAYLISKYCLHLLSSYFEIVSLFYRNLCKDCLMVTCDCIVLLISSQYDDYLQEIKL